VGTNDARQGFRLVLLAALGVVAVTSCGSQMAPPQPDDVLAIATLPSSGGGSTGLFAGTLIGVVNGDRTACFHMSDIPDIPMIWPAGYSARAHPLRVVDAHNRTVGVAGDSVRLGGAVVDLTAQRRLVGCGDASRVIAVG